MGGNITWATFCRKCLIILLREMTTGTKKAWFWYYFHRAKNLQEILSPIHRRIVYLCEVNKTLSAMEKFSHNITEQTIVNWYNQAKQGDAEAQYYAGMYESLYNDFRADMVYYWHKAAEQGLAKAQFRIGNCGYFGNNMSCDREEVMQWYEKAAAQGNADAKFGLELCRFADYNQAFQWCKEQAEAGVAEAQFILGLYYEYGSYVKPDREEAIRWFERAGEQGHEAANEWLAFVKYAKENSQHSSWRAQDGMALLDRIDKEKIDAQVEFDEFDYITDDLDIEEEEGTLTKEESKEKEEETYGDWAWRQYRDWWYREQVLDDIRIIRSSPYTYRKGLMKELKQKAEAGDVNAMTQLYEICEKNFANHSWSTYWLRKIAETGSNWAQAILAHRYENGCGVERNPAEAFKLYSALANKGDKIGVFFLAECFWLGKGTNVNVEVAIVLFEQIEEKYAVELMMKHSSLQNPLHSKLIEEAQERLKDKPGPMDKNGCRPLFFRESKGKN